VFTAVRRLLSYDKTLNIYDSPAGRLSLFGLAVPLLLESVLRMSLNTVNIVILSRYSDTAAAAISAATQVINMVAIFYTVISAGVSIVISQNLGAGRLQKASQAASMSLVICGMLGLVLGVVMAFYTRSLMMLMNLQGQMLEEAVAYFRYIALFQVLETLIMVNGAIFRSHGFARISLMVMLVVNGLNALFNAVVVFRPFETPLHGISGVALSRIIAEFLAMLLSFAFLRRARLACSLRDLLPVPFRLLKDILKVGFPGGITAVSYSISQTVTTAIMALLGSAVLSTKVYLSSFLFYVFLIGMAIGQATAIMIGRLVGAGDFDRAFRLNIQSLKIAMASNIVFSLVTIAFTGQIMSLFTQDPASIALARQIVVIDLFVVIGRALNHVEGNALNGAGDVVYQMVISSISCWCISVFFCWFLGVYLGLGLVGCWISFVLDELFRGLIYLRRWHSRKWVAKRLIRDEVQAEPEGNLS
jgi:putative MATE family efflux protein